MRIGVLGVVLAAGLAQAEPFVYQGSLAENGQAAEGQYDFEFLLYDSEFGGSQIGTVQILDDLDVTSGGFTAELDFGDAAFVGSQRWLEIRVREGASDGGYTLLSPRTKIGSTPQSWYASRAGLADDLTNSFWSHLAPGVLQIGENQSTDTLILNFNQVIEPTDVLVVHSAANGPGGMTLSTWGNGLPYYGYATNGAPRAKTYYDPFTDAWVVSKNGSDLLEIDANNDVVITNNLIVDGSITSMGGGGSTLVGYKTYTPDTIFLSFSFERLFDNDAGAVQTPNSTGYLRMDMDLPHGAVITNINVQFWDETAGTDLSFQLWKRDRVSLAFSSEILGESSGFVSNMVQTLDIVPDPALVIDNTECTYTLRVFSTSGSWPSQGLMGVRSVMFEYEQTLP